MRRIEREDGSVEFSITSCTCGVIPDQHYHIDHETVVPWETLEEAIQGIREQRVTTLEHVVCTFITWPGMREFVGPVVYDEARNLVNGEMSQGTDTAQ